MTSLPEAGSAPAPDAGPAAPAPRPARGPRLVTALAALVLALFVGLVAWLMVTERRVAAVDAPERALARVVARLLDLDQALQSAPAWERPVYELTVAQGASQLPQAIAWYEELAGEAFHPSVDLHLAILEAEAGRLDRVRRVVAEWPARGEPFGTFAALVTAAYLEDTDPESAAALRGTVDTLLAEWFHDRVAQRLAGRAGDGEWLEATRNAAAGRRATLLDKVRALVGLHAALLGVGGAAAWALARRRRGGARASVAQAPLPPPWSGRDGVVVLVRGAAAAALLLVALFLVTRGLGRELPLWQVASVPLVNLPVLVLARRVLLRPAGLGLVQAFGLRPAPAGVGPLALATAALAGAGVVLDLALGLAGAALGLGAHWTEWYDAELVWGDGATIAATMLGAVVLAPVLEELTFRGILYGTLRRRFAWPVAATLGAALFAAAHGYGAGGFASVFLSGVLWSWAYERTGSLLPGIAAHALSNLAATLMVLWFLRA